jgi:hypothetical protein
MNGYNRRIFALVFLTFEDGFNVIIFCPRLFAKKLAGR